MTATLQQRLTAEAIGTGFLLIALVGSGIMAESLAGGQVALMLLAVSVFAGATLAVMIALLGSVSGGHFNPAVTLVFALRGEMAWPIAGFYVLAQIAGAIIGVGIANLMFSLPVFEIAATPRTGFGEWLGEFVATFALVFTVLVSIVRASGATPWLVGAILAAAHWFTASAAFANPAVTIARIFTDTFTGILPAHAPAYVIAQLLGAVGALMVATFLVGAAAPAAKAPPAEPAAGRPPSKRKTPAPKA